MLDGIIRFSLKNRLIILAAAGLLLAYGIKVILDMPVDIFPDLNRPTVTIMVEAGGLSPEEVETLVTLPIETAMNGAPGVKRVRSTSGIGLAVVYVEFDWGTDIYLDRQLVNERLALAAERLPFGVTPVMAPVSSIMGEIMLIGLSSETGETPPMEQRTLADWVIRQRLLTIPGVSQVIAIGGGRKQYQVLIDPNRLAALGISLEEVEKALSLSQNNTTGGFLERRNQEFLIRNLGRTTEIDDIGKSVITYKNSVPVLVEQVAKVQIGPQVKRGDASVNAQPAVILSVQKQPGANTVLLTRQVEKALEEMKQGLPKDIRTTLLFKQANFIEAAIENVEAALRDGVILVIIVLFLFLANFRTTAITLTAIPLSFLITAVVFKLLGLSINTMTLGGLAVAIGELVDDAIVDVENVFRRLKENRHAAEPKPVLEVIYHASSEIRNSIVYATILVVLVFVPLLSLGGIEGRLFAPMGIGYIVSITASLFVSLTVTPVLCYFILPRAKVMEEKEYGSRFVRWLKEIDTRQLKWSLHHPKKVLTIVGLLLAASLAVVPFLGREFLPEFNEGTATINVLSVPGTSLTESNRVGTIAERLLLSVPEVASVGRRTGRAELDEHAEGVHYSEIDVDFKESKRSRAEILGEVRAKLSQIPGVVLNIGQPISHRLDHLLSGVRAQIAVKIFGPDLDTLRSLAVSVEEAMRSVPGVVDLQTEKLVQIPQVRVTIKREEARKYGVKIGELTEILETAFNGKVVSEVLDGQRTFDVLVRFSENTRASIETIQNALIDTASGTKVPLSAVAEVTEAKGPNAIGHENIQRRIVVSCNTSGRDLGAVIEEIQKNVKTQVNLPVGYFVTYGGQFESQQQATRQIAFLSLFALGGMILVVYHHFRSLRIMAQIFMNIPLAYIGAITGILLTGGVFSIASLVGLITLMGITHRNTIMMISHYINLVLHEGEAFNEKMIIRGSLERLVPVLMTALTAGLALVPLVLAKGEPGKEILYPVAVVILSGLVSSTLLDMIVTPTVFFHYGQPAVDKYIEEKKKGTQFHF